MEEDEYDAPVEPAHHLSVLQNSGRKAGKRSRFPFKTLIVIGIACILVGVGIVWGGKRALEIARGLFPTQQVVDTPKNLSAPGTKPKIPDRLGQPSSVNQVAPVAQRAVLYEQDPSDPNGRQQSVGTVVWRIEPTNASDPGGDIAVRADIEIPDRKFKLTMTFQRNTDPNLPATHTVELIFNVPPDFQGGGVAKVVGLTMKSGEEVRGMPLEGSTVNVTDGYFLSALSNTDQSKANNRQLLKERPWFDIMLVYANQRQALLAIDKGEPGQRAFDEAFTEWGQ